jgi:hypothetical protein
MGSKPQRRLMSIDGVMVALDLAIETGFAIGRAGERPRSGSVRLKKRCQDERVAWRNLGCWLRDQFKLERPDLVVYEAALDPHAMVNMGNSSFTVAMQWGHIAALEAICGPLALRTEPINVQSVRKHFTGRARWPTRHDAKRAVLERCWMLGYFGRDCKNDNRADACAVFDYASAVYGKRSLRSAELVMFEERSGYESY